MMHSRYLAGLIISAGIGFALARITASNPQDSVTTELHTEFVRTDSAPPAPIAPSLKNSDMEHELLKEIRALRSEIAKLSQGLPVSNAPEGNVEARRAWERLIIGSIAEFRDAELRQKLEFAIRAQIGRIRAYSEKLSLEDEEAIRGFERQLEAIKQATSTAAILKAANAPPLEYAPQDPRFEEYERQHGDVFVK
jgi:hypothetical protein